MIRPIPPTILISAILGLCVLCASQWYRESKLQKIGVDQRTELINLKFENEELVAYAKKADAEILALNGSLGELRANSVSIVEHEELLHNLAEARQNQSKQNENILKQYEQITIQNEAITIANTSIEKANETIKKLTAERDGLVKKLNDLTSKYNKMVKSK